MSRLLGLLFVSLIYAVSAQAQEAARVALLIGNQTYDASVGVLINPHNDIRIVGAALRQQGFEVLPEVKDARRSTILGAVRQLRDRLNSGGAGSIGFLYYSGHGAAEADTGINYLIPVDAKQPGSSEFWDESLKLDDILKLLDGARAAAKFIVFDACRNELRVPAKSTTKGLAPIAEQQGMLIAYATSPGRTASDQGDQGGPFATALAAEFARPGLDHLNLFQNVKETVLAATKGAQQPWINDGLSRRVSLTPMLAPVAKVDKDLEIAFWNSVKDSNDPDLLATYIDKFPEGNFAALARIMTERAKAMRDAQATATSREADLKRAVEAQRAAEARQAEEQRKADAAKRQAELKAAQEQLAKAQAAMAVAEAEKQAALSAADEARKAATAAKVERDAVAQSVGQETAKVASLGETSQPKQAEVTPAMLRLIKSELSRVGCDPGSSDGQWTEKSRVALEQFGKRTKIAVHAATPDAGTLDLLTRQKERVCPLICPEGEAEKDGKCARKPAASAPPSAKTSANRPDAVEYSRGIWPTDTIGNKNVVSKTTPYGSLTCTGGPLPGVRFCHWD